MKDISGIEIWKIKMDNNYCPYLVLGKCNYNYDIKSHKLPWCNKDICKIKI